jgi:hypothetical protein
MPTFLIKSGIPQAEPIELKAGVNSIGRAPGNDFQLNHPSVSGAHCEIVVADDCVFVRDLGSTNGTFVNRQPVKESEVTPGQTLHLGAVALLYQPVEVAAPIAKPAGLRVAKVAEPAAPPVLPTPTGLLDPERPRMSTMPVVHAPAYATFFQSLPSAFSYPLRKGGIFLLVVGSLFFSFMDFLTKNSFGLASLLMGVIGYGYLAAYLQKIIVCTSEGEDELPDYPEFSSYWEDIIHPALLMVGAFAVSFGPAFAIWVFTDIDPGFKAMLAIAVGIFGCFYLPMALIAVSMYGSLMALNPLLIVPSMVKTVGPYIVACLMVAVLGAVKAGMTYLLELAIPIPVVPAIIAGFVSLYFVTMEMRVLGLLYYYKKDELRWSF